MGELDLTEASFAALTAMWPKSDPNEIDPYWLDKATDAVIAAAPLIEAAVREQERQRFSAILDGFDKFGVALSTIQGVAGPIGKSLRTAVLAARGGAS